jgi:hypothetical protein
VLVELREVTDGIDDASRPAPGGRDDDSFVVADASPLGATIRDMIDATCRPILTLAPVSEREQRPDRFPDLLARLADLLVETAQQRVEVAQLGRSEDSRVREAAERLAELECSLREVSIEAASVHQLLQHVRLI